ncbi:alcohol dehydrogenase [Rhodococcus sp. WS4]|nr:alcohol dehydrogenase [Rhodococcus sp. WS4]
MACPLAQVRQFAIGDHVVATLIRSCGHCTPCRTARPFQCQNPDETLRSPGARPRLQHRSAPITSVFGTAAFAEYSLVHQNQLVKVPNDLPFPQAAVLGCSALTGAGAAINSARVRPGNSVVVIGLGGVGLNVISGAKLAGAGQIVAVDANPQKEALARSFGATHFVNALAGDPVSLIMELTSGGADHVFEAVGLDETISLSLKSASVGGAVYLMGVREPGNLMGIDVFTDLIRKQVSIEGVYMGASDPAHDIPMYASLYLQGRFNLDDLISKTGHISEINEMYSELNSGNIARAVITSFT